MPQLPVAFHPAALQESVAAEAWYREHSDGSALAFVKELERAVRQIHADPTRWVVHAHDTRRFLLRRFPFSVIYRIGSSEIEIIAVAHGRRRPDYWQAR